MVIAFHGLEPLYYEALAAELARTGERLSAQFILFHQRLVPRLLAFATSRADRVFCLNSREHDFIVSRGWAEAARVRVVPNGVERDLFREGRVYAARASRLLFTGQWLRAKGIRYLVQAFESLASRHPVIELTCVGTGAEAGAVRRDFAPSVRDRVRVLPQVTREELAGELDKADIFVFPSLSEGFSGALLEAMASGLPVVATSAGAAADLLRPGENALIVPFADGPALIESIDTLIDRADLRQHVGAAARATAAGYEWDAVNEHFASELLATVTTSA
jgi:glycosyltransferase involved in cell wall biosynthesis